MRSGGGDRCPDNLLARSRRGPVSAVERRALDAHLGVCDLCRATLAFGTLYDDLPDGPHAEDEIVVARLAKRLAYGPREVRARTQARAWAVAAALFLMVAAGGAAAWVGARRPSKTSAPTTTTAYANGPRGTGAPPRTPESSASAETVGDPAMADRATGNTSASAEAHPHRRQRPGGAVGATNQTASWHPASEPSAAALFAAANTRRREHALREAVRQYDALAQRFPDSEEAWVSLVSAGDLLARLGEPAAALQHLDRYLATHAAGRLAPEAMFARARCFEQLHRRPDERAAWNDSFGQVPRLDLRAYRASSIGRALAVTRRHERARDLSLGTGARAVLRTAWIVASLAVVAPRLARGEARMTRVEIVLVADEACAPQLRAVLVEQLAGVADDISWSCRLHLDEDDLFRAPPVGAAAVRIWIDPSTPADTRLYLEDERTLRFVVRRLALTRGIDEVSREEIGQIARSGTLAVLAGRSETLTRAQVKSTLSAWMAVPPANQSRERDQAPQATSLLGETRARTSLRESQPRSPPSFEVGPVWAAQALARALPIMQEIALGVSVHPESSAVSVSLEAGIRLPATADVQPVNVHLGAAAARLGLAYRRTRSGNLAWRVSAGVGLNRLSFAAETTTTGVDPAPAGHFYALTGRIAFGTDWRAAAHVTMGLALFCDLAVADVHYDLRDAAGVSHRLFTQFGVMPGAAVSLAWRSSSAP